MSQVVFNTRDSFHKVVIEDDGFSSCTRLYSPGWVKTEYGKGKSIVVKCKCNEYERT